LKKLGCHFRIQAIDFFGEPAGIRTRDLLIKSQLLYRLSYRLF
jgi:hypothetical protein